MPLKPILRGGTVFGPVTSTNHHRFNIPTTNKDMIRVRGIP